MLSALHQRTGCGTAYALEPDMLPFHIEQRRLSLSYATPKGLLGKSRSESQSDQSATHSCSEAATTPAPSPANHAHRHLPIHKPSSLHQQLRLAIGDVISEEQLLEKLTFGRLLGSGATSKVYSAIEHATGREVAVKVFDKAAMIEVRRSMAAHGDVVKEKAVHRVRRRLQKVLSEIELSRSLDHPHIIQFLGAYETSHRICILHELVDGGDLLEHLLAHGKMSERDAASIFHQLLQAMQYCHARHIYHRDLKLENVLLTKDRQVKLIDFGLSEYVPPGSTLRTICGTPLYCSPEVLFLSASARELGFAGGPADVWSVGILVFALLTGCAPFDDSNFAKLRLDVHRNRIAYPSYLSNDVKGLLKTLLIHDPHLRPTVGDMLEYPWIQRGSGAAEVSPDGAPSPLCSKMVRSLSGIMSDRGTDTTASTSGSFEADDKPTLAATADALTKITEEPHATHLSCLESELEQLCL